MSAGYSELHQNGTVEIPTVNMREEVERILRENTSTLTTPSRIDMVSPMFVELKNMLSGRRYIVNPAAIMSVREWSVPLRKNGKFVAIDGEKKECLRVDISGFDAPILVDMTYDGMMKKILPSMVVSPL